LTERQVAYAALDAWVLVELLRVLRADHGEELDRFAAGVTRDGA
jgi:ribonuclease D